MINMWKIGPFIIKAKCLGYTGKGAKTLWAWTGLHHYCFTLFLIILGYMFYCIDGAGGAYIAALMHYLIKEITEGGKTFEILDFLSPLVFGKLTLIMILYIEGLL